MKKLITLSVFLICFFQANSQSIPSTFYGINHWMPNKYIHYPSYPSGVADYPPTQTLVANAGAKFYRIGGTGYDSLGTAIGTDSAHNDYIAAILKVKLANPNARFLIQVPFSSDSISAANAATLVQNIAGQFPSPEKFYYAIGNEWDQYIKPAAQGGGKYTSTEIKNIIKSYSIQMKNADSTIRIVAPALSNFKATDSLGNGIMKRLIGGADDITGIITSTGFPTIDGIKYFVDVIDYHFYGGSYGFLSSLTAAHYDSIRNGIINSPYNGGFKKNLDSLQVWLHNPNLSRTASPLTFAITEMNVCLYNPSATIVPGDTTTNSTEGIACRSFFAGQAWADIMSTTLASSTTTNNAKCEFIMPWSIHESNGNGDTLDHSMTKGTATSTTAPTPLSTYHHYNLMSQYINANYYSGISSISPNVKTFASIDMNTNFIYVMILNRNNRNYDYNIGFEGSDDTAGAHLHLHFDFSPTIYVMDTTTYPYYTLPNDTIRANSTVVLWFNCHGSLIMKKTYSLDDARNDAPPAITQVGNIAVDMKAMNRNLIDCGHAGGIRIGGSITTNTTYLNDTIYVTSDINITGSTELTFAGCLVILSEGVRINSGQHSSIVLLNTVMAGCEGKTWKGIEMLGNYYNTERLHVTNSVILNAEIPLWTNQIADIAITHSALVNGKTGINMNASQAFSITKNLIAGFKTGINTTNTVKDYVSEIKDNRIIEVEDAMKFTSDEHNKLDIWCNEMLYTGNGITTTSTDLQTQGSSGTGAQNRFTKTVPDIYLNYLKISGSSPTYYYGPSETVPFSKPNISNITTTVASADRTCYHIFLDTCDIALAINQSPPLPNPQLSIYPNPNSGTFTISFANLTRGLWTLNVYDMLGKLITTNKVEADSKTTTLQIFTKGLYFVSLQNGNNRLTQKVIVN